MPKALHFLGNEEDGDFGLQISDFGLIEGIGVGGCELRGASCGLRGAGCVLGVASCELRVAECVLRVTGFVSRGQRA